MTIGPTKGSTCRWRERNVRPSACQAERSTSHPRCRACHTLIDETDTSPMRRAHSPERCPVQTGSGARTRDHQERTSSVPETSTPQFPMSCRIGAPSFGRGHGHPAGPGLRRNFVADAGRRFVLRLAAVEAGWGGSPRDPIPRAINTVTGDRRDAGTVPTESNGSETQWMGPDRPQDRPGAGGRRSPPQRLSLTTPLPGLTDAPRTVRRLLGGWSLSGVVAARSGNPFTVGIQGDYARTLARASVHRRTWGPASIPIASSSAVPNATSIPRCSSFRRGHVWNLRHYQRARALAGRADSVPESLDCSLHPCTTSTMVLHLPREPHSEL